MHQLFESGTISANLEGRSQSCTISIKTKNVWSGFHLDFRTLSRDGLTCSLIDVNDYKIESYKFSVTYPQGGYPKTMSLRRP